MPNMKAYNAHPAVGEVIENQGGVITMIVKVPSYQVFTEHQAVDEGIKPCYNTRELSERFDQLYKMFGATWAGKVCDGLDAWLEDHNNLNSSVRDDMTTRREWMMERIYA